MNIAIPLFALAYSGAILFMLANALRKIYPPVRAALTAFAISAALHTGTLLFVDAESRLVALLFWLVPHVLLLPLLLLSARRANRD